MDKMGYEKGLVRYTTQNRIDGKETHLFRPRIVIYATLLVLISLTLVYSIATRVPLELDIIRDRNSLYRETVDGLVENVYTLKLINMDTREHRYQLHVNGLKEMVFIQPESEIKIKSGEVINLAVRIQIDPINLKKTSSEVTFSLKATDQENLAVTEKARFIGPLPK
jgi:polyferredoxin